MLDSAGATAYVTASCGATPRTTQPAASTPEPISIVRGDSCALALASPSSPKKIALVAFIITNIVMMLTIHAMRAGTA